MSGTLEEELENIKASLKNLGAIEESMISENYGESVSDFESIQESEPGSRMGLQMNWRVQGNVDLESDRSYSAERNLQQANEIIKEKSNLINRLYSCIEELKGELQELTSSLDYHMQLNTEMEKELEFYRYSKEPNDNYVIST